MNLADLADYVCAKVRQTDSNSLSACKDFLSKRYELVYQSELWRDSIIEFQKSVDVTDTLVAAGFVQLPRVINRVLAARSDTRELTVENAEIYFRQTSDQFALSGTPISYNLLGRACWRAAEPAALTVACADEGDAGSTVKIRWVDENNELQVSTISVTTAAQELGNGYLVEAFTKDTTTGSVIIYADGEAILTVTASQTSYEPYHYIRLIQKPQQDFTLRVLAKKKFTPLTFDSDEPYLLDADNCLIAFGQADMLERQRQYAKAQAKMTEALGLMNAMAKIEIEQQASNARLVPACDNVTPGYYEYQSKGDF